MIVLDELLKIMPHAGANAAKYLTPLNDAMHDCGIDLTANREAMFLGQVAHESGELRYSAEIWGPTDAQEKYEHRLDLGNINPGDGKKFKGRGLIQITGRANYSKVSDVFKVNFLTHPELMEQPDYAAKTAAWFWQTHGCNELADKMAYALITKKINGGMNGWPSRLVYLANAKGVLSV
ncbi:MAG: glycoside hydrolase family 19 protein [Sulfuriferula sp.]